MIITDRFKAVLLIWFSVFACFGVSFCTVFIFCVSRCYIKLSHGNLAYVMVTLFIKNIGNGSSRCVIFNRCVFLDAALCCGCLSKSPAPYFLVPEVGGRTLCIKTINTFVLFQSRVILPSSEQEKIRFTIFIY